MQSRGGGDEKKRKIYGPQLESVVTRGQWHRFFHFCFVVACLPCAVHCNLFSFSSVALSPLILFESAKSVFYLDIAATAPHFRFVFADFPPFSSCTRLWGWAVGGRNVLLLFLRDVCVWTLDESVRNELCVR